MVVGQTCFGLNNIVSILLSILTFLDEKQRYYKIYSPGPINLLTRGHFTCIIYWDISCYIKLKHYFSIALHSFQHTFETKHDCQQGIYIIINNSEELYNSILNHFIHLCICQLFNLWRKVNNLVLTKKQTNIFWQFYNWISTQKAIT